jgi:hypothetical protein
MSHDHHNHCDHEMAYCARCDVEYCRKCSREWGRYVWTNPYSWPYTITWQGMPHPQLPITIAKS